MPLYFSIGAVVWADSGGTGSYAADRKANLPSDDGDLRRPTRLPILRPSKHLLASPILVPRPWFSPHSDDPERPQRTGFKLLGGGPHQSKTMMLADLGALIAADMELQPTKAIVADNLLGKPTGRARGAAAYQLQQLYGVGETPSPISLALFVLWRRDPTARPLLALLCALARDPTLRAGADAVLNARLGDHVRWPSIAATFEAANPGRLSIKSVKSLAQNAASSWTQAGHLFGAVLKTRLCVEATPTAAAYAALLASLSGFGGASLLASRWLDILDRTVEGRLALLRQAEGLGLLRVRQAGDVVEIDARRPMADALGVPSLVHG